MFSHEFLEENWGVEYSEAHEVHDLIPSQAQGAQLIILRRECSRGDVYWSVGEAIPMAPEDAPESLLFETPIKEWWSNSENEYIRFALMISWEEHTVKSVFDQGDDPNVLKSAAPEREVLLEAIRFAAS